PVKEGVCVATPAVPAPANVVQQWMCAALVLPSRPVNSVSTRMVNRSRSKVTSAVPVPGEALGGDSFRPDSTAAYWISCAAAGATAATLSIRVISNARGFMERYLRQE